MKDIPAYSNIKKLQEMIVTERDELKKQLDEVKVKYPLVALAYCVQTAIVAEVLLDTVAIQPEITLDEETYRKLVAEFKERKRNRERCLGEARTYWHRTARARRSLRLWKMISVGCRWALPRLHQESRYRASSTQ